MDHVEPDEQTSSRFFHYQDSVYDIADFMRDDRFPEWHASYPLNAFAMLMIRLTDSGDTIDIGLLHWERRATDAGGSPVQIDEDIWTFEHKHRLYETLFRLFIIVIIDFIEKDGAKTWKTNNSGKIN